MTKAAFLLDSGIKVSESDILAILAIQAVKQWSFLTFWPAFFPQIEQK